MLARSKLNKIESKISLKTNIFRIQAYDSIMCEYCCSDLLISYLQERLWLTLAIFFHQRTLKTMII